MKKRIVILMLCTIYYSYSYAQNITITTTDGYKHVVAYRNSTIKNNGVEMDNGEFLDFNQIAIISTDHFDAYERAMKKIPKKESENVSIQFTGDQNLYALQLEKLKKKRDNAHIARGAGGLLVLIGALSGDRDLYNAGVVTYGAGTIARDINTEKTIEAQNDAIVALQENQKRQKEVQDLDAQYRAEYGNENVDGLYALIEKNYERSLALANVGETSDDANHRLAAVWLKAIIYADQGNTVLAEKEYQRLIVLDPEVSSLEEGARWMDLLLEDLDEMRKEL